MGWLGLLTADIGDIDQWSNFSDRNKVAVSSTCARTGTSSFKIISYAYPENYIYDLPVATSTLYTRICYLSRGNNKAIYDVLNANGTQLTLARTGAQLILKRGTESGPSLLKTDPDAMPNNTWTCVEIYTKIHPTDGAAAIRINGVVAASGSNLNTLNSGTDYYITRIRAGELNTGAPEMYLDDVAFRDDDWPGTGGIYVLSPCAEGASANWSPSGAASPYQCVDEIPVSFVDYIYAAASVPGTRHTFGIQDMPVTATTIACVAVYAKAQVKPSGSAVLKTSILSGSAYTAGGSKALDATSVWTAYLEPLDPNTGSAWTLAAVNALQAGVETA